MRRLTYLIAIVVVSAGISAYGQNTDQKNALQQRLTSQFVLTKISSDKNDIVTAGAKLQLQKDGLVMCSTASPGPSSNTYKGGKISQGSSVGRLLASQWPGMDSVLNSMHCPQRQFSANEALWVTAIDTDDNNVIFHLYSDPYDDIRYYGNLKIPLGKSPDPEKALAKVAEVLTVLPSENSADTTKVPEANQPAQPAQPPQPAPPPVQLNLPAVYSGSQSPGDRLQLNADKSFQLQEGGQAYHGTFTESGNNLELSIAETDIKTTVTVLDKGLTDSSGHLWTLQNLAPTNASNGPVLNNKDVIKMTKAGLDEGMILTKIASSKCQFDTSTDALIELKRNGVSTSVMKAMLSK